MASVIVPGLCMGRPFPWTLRPVCNLTMLLSHPLKRWDMMLLRRMKQANVVPPRLQTQSPLPQAMGPAYPLTVP